jgi:hypothetical protein
MNVGEQRDLARGKRKTGKGARCSGAESGKQGEWTGDDIDLRVVGRSGMRSLVQDGAAAKSAGREERFFGDIADGGASSAPASRIQWNFRFRPGVSLTKQVLPSAVLLQCL